MNRRDFQRLARIRLKDAEVLLKNGRFEAAYYLAGYAVECAPKACIAKQTARHDFPPRDTKNVYTHKIGDLMKAAKLDEAAKDEARRDKEFAATWSLCKMD